MPPLTKKGEKGVMLKQISDLKDMVARRKRCVLLPREQLLIVEGLVEKENNPLTE